ncbi:MAG: hypothetical protein WCE54_08545, partial [Ignavibacteriaceae bacterium]
MKSFLFLILFPLITTNLFGDSLSNNTAAKFINSLIRDRDQLNNFILPEELNISGRLGIEYSGIDNKCLISNDIAPSLRKKISNKELSFTYKIEKLNDDYTKLVFSIPSIKFVREFYFKGSYLISSPFYFGRKWRKEESKFFISHISNPLLFNHYAEEN